MTQLGNTMALEGSDANCDSYLGTEESLKLSLRYPSLTVESALSKKELTDPTDSLLVIFGQSGVSLSGSCL